MELYEIKQNLLNAQKKLLSLEESLNLPKLKKELEEMDQKQTDEHFWDDPKSAQHLIKEYNTKKELYETCLNNKKSLEDLLVTVDDLNKNFDEELALLLEEEYKEAIKRFDDFEIKVLLSNDYDHSNAILEIHPGAGGTESQDWAMMLYRMYQRYAQKNNYGFEVLD